MGLTSWRQKPRDGDIIPSNPSTKNVHSYYNSIIIAIKKFTYETLAMNWLHWENQQFEVEKLGFLGITHDRHFSSQQHAMSFMTHEYNFVTLI
jgi:hypothetical protein